MEHEIKIAFKKQVFSELAIAQRAKLVSNIAERFEAVLAEFMVVLPIKSEIKRFEWVVGSISHEYLHLIITELESEDSGKKLDNLGYNLATGYFEEEI